MIKAFDTDMVDKWMSSWSTWHSRDGQKAVPSNSPPRLVCAKQWRKEGQDAQRAYRWSKNNCFPLIELRRKFYQGFHRLLYFLVSVFFASGCLACATALASAGLEAGFVSAIFEAATFLADEAPHSFWFKQELILLKRSVSLHEWPWLSQMQQRLGQK